MSILSQAHFHNKEAAYAFVESRIWPPGPVCPHCGDCEQFQNGRQKHTHRRLQVLVAPQAVHCQS